jgi:hypothetical protein
MKQKLSHSYQKDVLAYRTKELRSKLEIVSARYRIAVLRIKLAEAKSKTKRVWLNSDRAMSLKNELGIVYELQSELMDNIKTLGTLVYEAEKKKKQEGNYNARDFEYAKNKLILPLARVSEMLSSRVGGAQSPDPMLGVWGESPRQVSTKNSKYLAISAEDAIANIEKYSNKIKSAFNTLASSVRLLENWTINEAPNLLDDVSQEINTLKSNSVGVNTTSGKKLAPKVQAEIDKLKELSDLLIRQEEPMLKLVS